MKSTVQNCATVWQFQDVLLERYCFAPNLAVPPHSHEEYQIGLTFNAPGEYEYRGATHPIPIGGLSILHSGEVHIGRSLSTGQTAIVTRKLYISSAHMQRVVAELTERSLTALPFIPTPIIVERKLFKGFLHLHKTLGGPASHLEQESLLLSTLTQLIQLYAESQPRSRPYGLEHQAVQRVREYLHDRYAENVSLSQLAEIAQLNAYRLCHVFAQEVGLPPHRYQTQVRITQAKSLLMRGEPLAQVALITGFSHQSHFGRYFKQIVGVTPGRYIASNNVIDRQDEDSVYL